MEVVKHRVLSGSKVMTGDEHQYCKRKGVPRGTDDQHCPSRMGKIVQVGRFRSGSNDYYTGPTFFPDCRISYDAVSFFQQ
jgi:hypothetical protein